MKLFRIVKVRKSRKTKIINRPPSVPKSLSVAQQTGVAREENFLTQTEIAKVLKHIVELDLPMYTSNQYDDIDTNGDPVHTTMYLQTDNIFASTMPWLHAKIIQCIRFHNNRNHWGFNLSSKSKFSIRVAEYHEMMEGGALADPRHYDIGSLITMDIMLKEADQGALFQTLELVDSVDNVAVDVLPSAGSEAETVRERLQVHDFHAGDALLFVSHKYHCVSKLLKGSRKVLVVEVWSGEKRVCGHRCDCTVGPCDFITD